MNQSMIGIDIGGTSVKMGIFTYEGNMIDKWEITTNKADNGSSILDDIWHSITGKLNALQIDKQTVLGLGVGAPGFIDKQSGIVLEAVNIGWKQMHLQTELKKRSGLPVFIENDANIAALGENWKGAGNQANDVVAVTIGTGVGGGIIANGEIISGESGMAGEFGHFMVEPENGYRCNCGNNGCLETIASATAIVRQANEKIAENPDSQLAAYVKDNKTLSAKDVFSLAKKNDAESMEIINRVADALGFAIATVGIMTNPQKVLIGGGVSKAGDFLIHAIKQSFKKYALPGVAESCEIKLTELGNDAGMIGGAYLVKQEFSEITF